MSWNYEKGCEEPNAYKDPNGSVYSPPNWPTHISASLQLWVQQELWLDRAKMGTTLYSERRATTLRAFYAVEQKLMDWMGVVNSDKFRRGYLEWLVKEGIASKAEGVVDEVDAEDLPILERMVALGFRELAKKAHPDNQDTGSAAKFREISEAKQKLMSLLDEVKNLL